MTIAQRLAELNSEQERNARVDDFIQIAAYKLAGLKIEDLDSKKFSQRTRDVIKAAVIPGSTTGSALVSYSALSQAFLASNRYSAFDTMFEAFTRLPTLHSRAVTANVLGITAFQTAQSSAKSLSTLSLTADQTEPTKVAACVVVSDELAKVMTPDSLRFIGDELRIGVGVETDEAFISILTSGLTAIPSTGVTPLAVRADLRNMLNSITTNSQSRMYLLTTSKVAKELSVIGGTAGTACFPEMTPNGGMIDGITTLVSDGLAVGQIVMLDATQIVAARGDVTLNQASTASLQLDSAPSSPPTASTVPTSLWQHNLAALRAERYFTAARPRITSVAMVSGAGYSGNSPN